MSIPGSATPLLLATTAAAPAAALQIDRSLRFNSADSAYLSRTPSSASNRKTWTLSFWVKLCGSSGHLISAGNDAFQMEIRSDGQYLIQNSGCFNNTYSTAVFRDHSAWQHFVIEHDATNTYCKIYVNGSLQKTITTSNSNGTFNNNTAHNFNGRSTSLDSFTDFYLTEAHFIDGQALDPTSFAEADSDGNWNPKAYSGSGYGSNGFYLKFADPDDLGNDSSGNNNDFTPNNLVGSTGIATAEQGHDVVTWTGNGSSQTLSSLAFQPDLVWIKRRDADGRHMIFNSIRGATKGLHTGHTATEFTDSATLTGFTSSGFSVGSHALANANSGTYVGWCWRAGGSAASNSDGTITSSVTANNTYGFSVVLYTGQTNAGTVGHGLSSGAPKFIITKNLDRNCDWIVYHESLDSSNPEDKFLRLNQTTGPTTSADYWGSGGVTDSVFGVANGVFVNLNGEKVIAYCWSEISGFSKFSSYTGSGSSGNKVTTGFKPKWVMVKRTTNISGSHMGWVIIDSERGHNKRLSAQSLEEENDGPINAASSPNDDITFQDDGFTLASGASATNGNGETYVFAAYADKPDPSVIDSLLDTPTNYTADSGNNGGNYATLNPLNTLGSSPSLANGNLQVTSTASYDTLSTIGVSSGKWYCELTVTAKSSLGIAGIIDIQNTRPSQFSISGQNYVAYRSTGTVEGNQTGGTGFSWAQGDTLGFALDLDSSTQTLKVYKNGSLQSTSNITASGVTWAMNYFYSEGTSDYTVNFGQRPFAYTPPTGYLSICTQNLPDPTIADGSTAFDTSLYTGTGSSRSITGLNHSPDFVWIKQRNSSSNYHNLFDVIRGTTKALYSNDTLSEQANANTLSAFNSDGFTVGTDGAVNGSSGSYVAWAWDAGSSTVSNTDGSITSNVRANASAGFSIVTASASSAGNTIGHGLNAAPNLIVAKRTGTTSHWPIYHSSIGANGFLYLNLTNAAGTGADFWNNSAPTSSVFTVGSDAGVTGGTTVFLCFTSVAGYSAFGSYSGTGSQNFIHTGFRPAFILMKSTNNTGSWHILDSSRDVFNGANNSLISNSSNAESSGHPDVDFVSNGFTLQADSTGYSNYSGFQYVYWAIAEHPFKTSRAR